MCFLDGFTGAYGMNSEKKYDATLKMVVSNMNLYLFLLFFFQWFIELRFPCLFFGGVYVSRSKVSSGFAKTGFRRWPRSQQAEMQWIGSFSYWSYTFFMIPKQLLVFVLRAFLRKKTHEMHDGSLKLQNAGLWMTLELIGASKWRITSDLEDRPVDITLIYMRL